MAMCFRQEPGLHGLAIKAIMLIIIYQNIGKKIKCDDDGFIGFIGNSRRGFVCFV